MIFVWYLRTPSSDSNCRRFFTVCSFVVIFQHRCFKWPSIVFLMIAGELLIENDSFPVSLNLMAFRVLRVALCSLVDVSVVICKMWSCDKSTFVILFLGIFCIFPVLDFCLLRIWWTFIAWWHDVMQKAFDLLKWATRMFSVSSNDSSPLLRMFSDSLLWYIHCRHFLMWRFLFVVWWIFQVVN